MIDLWEKNTQVHSVQSFKALTETPFVDQRNAIVWPRKLRGDFYEIVEKFEFSENMKELELEELMELDLSEAGQLARTTLIEDLKALEEHGVSPILNLIKAYERDDAYPLFPTDVYSYHVDRSPVPTDTFLCTYHGASSEILPNAEGEQKIQVPEIRAELKKLYGEEDEEGFKAFLSEYFFDLHYQAKAEAQTIKLGIGNLWKLAVDHPQSQVPPCLHRAPKENDGEVRLLLIC